jgi:hypothetical protein
MYGPQIEPNVLFCMPNKTKLHPIGFQVIVGEYEATR